MNKLLFKTHNFLILLLALGLAAALQACSSGGGGSGVDAEEAGDRSYNGPGSKWDVTLRTDDSFTITRRPDASSAVDLTVNGDYEELASGFLHFVVSDASGSGAPSSGDEAWGLEIEGYALMLKPVDPGSDQVIPMINSGTCPASDFTANWVLVRKASSTDATDAGRDFFGVFDYEVASNTPTLPDRFALDNNFTSQGAGNISSGTCSDGLMLVSDAEMFLTENGGAIVHTNISDSDESSFIFALAQSPIADIDNVDGEYSGMLFDESSSAGDRIQPVAVTCAAGTCNGNIVTDIETGDTSAEAVTISLNGTVDDLADGLVTGTITGGSGSGNLACMVDYDALGSGTKIVSCVGQSPGDNTRMFNIILAS